MAEPRKTVSREEFEKINDRVDSMEARLLSLSEKVIESVAKLGENLKSIEALLKQAVADTRNNQSLCKSECNNRLEKIEEKIKEEEGRIRSLELGWAKLLGMATLVAFFSSVISTVIIKLIFKG